MQAFRIRPLMFVDGRRVQRVSDPIMSGRTIVRLHFYGDSKPRDFLPDYDVPNVKARCEVPAGPTPSDSWFVAGPPKPTADPMRGKWRGERNGTKADELIEVAKAFDAYAG